MSSWKFPLNLSAAWPEVLAKDWQVIFKYHYPGASFPWVLMVQKDGVLAAVKTLIVVVPEAARRENGECGVIGAIHSANPSHCKVLLTQELRPYPALVREAAGELLTELPGGMLDAGDGSIYKAALRGCAEEAGITEERVLA